MRRRRSPPEKKKLAYERDFPTYAEYPHAFRASWPKREAIAQRSFRRRVKRALTAEDEGAVDAVRRKRVLKWRPLSLGARVHEKLGHRAQRTGRKFFSRAYRGAVHREAFTRFLEALMAERSGIARDHARMFAQYVDAAEGSRFAGRGEWLARYFDDVPGVRARFVRWLEEVGFGL